MRYPAGTIHVCTPLGLRDWARRAPAGAAAIYHVGELARDRASSTVVDALADLAAALAEAGRASLTQRPIGYREAVAYIVERRGGDHPLIHARVTPREWRALRAIETRPPELSATRAVRDGLSLPNDGEAKALVEGMIARGLAERMQGDRGSHAPAVVLTARGRGLL